MSGISTIPQDRTNLFNNTRAKASLTGNITSGKDYYEIAIPIVSGQVIHTAAPDVTYGSVMPNYYSMINSITGAKTAFTTDLGLIQIILPAALTGAGNITTIGGNTVAGGITTNSTLTTVAPGTFPVVANIVGALLTPSIDAGVIVWNALRAQRPQLATTTAATADGIAILRINLIWNSTGAGF